MNDYAEIQENADVESGVNPIWKSAFLMLGTFVLGAAIPLFVTRNDITPDTLGAALTPLQKQLDGISIQQGALQSQVTDLKIDIAGMRASMKLKEIDGK